MNDGSVFEGIAEDLAHGFDDMMPPSSLKFSLIVGWEVVLEDGDVAFILLGIFEDDFDIGEVIPIIEFPVHFDIFVGSEGDKLA